MNKVIIDKDNLSAFHFDWDEYDEEKKVYSVDFKIYDISWICYNGKTGEKDYPSYFDLEDYDNKSDYKPNENTLPKVEGHIKWDGCCNYKYNEEAYLHRCGLDGFKSDLDQLKKVYEVSAEIMGDVADLDMMGLKEKK